MITVFLAIFIAIFVLIVGGVFSQPIVKVVRRRLPGFSYEGDLFLLAGLLALAAFTLGLVVMYLQ